MSGLIDMIENLGVETSEHARRSQRALVGGAKIPYAPDELAAITTILRQSVPTSYLALECVSRGGMDFLKTELKINDCANIGGLAESKLETCKFLRHLTHAYDLISIDGRGLPIDANSVWRYLHGGKDEMVAFAKGAPRDYGVKKIKNGTHIILNLADQGTKELWFKLRAGSPQIRYQGAHAVMVMIRE